MKYEFQDIARKCETPQSCHVFRDIFIKKIKIKFLLQIPRFAPLTRRTYDGVGRNRFEK